MSTLNSEWQSLISEERQENAKAALAKMKEKEKKIKKWYTIKLKNNATIRSNKKSSLEKYADYDKADSFKR